MAQLKPRLLGAYLCTTMPAHSPATAALWQNAAVDSLGLLSEGEVSCCEGGGRLPCHARCWLCCRAARLRMLPQHSPHTATHRALCVCPASQIAHLRLAYRRYVKRLAVGVRPLVSGLQALAGGGACESMVQVAARHSQVGGRAVWPAAAHGCVHGMRLVCA